MLIKICGITRTEDARAAIAGGADALGFVLWPQSPRYVTPSAVRAIVDGLSPSASYVGVFVNQSLQEVNAAAEMAGLTHVQLHGDETSEFAARVRRPVIKATSLASRGLDEDWPATTLWLVDGHDPVRRGGTGVNADWAAAAAFARTRRVLLAGGLTPENVAEAISRVQPFGIDVSSGVELEPGIKDHARLAALLDIVHAIERSAGPPSRHGRFGAQGAEGREGGRWMGDAHEKPH